MVYNFRSTKKEAQNIILCPKVIKVAFYSLFRGLSVLVSSGPIRIPRLRRVRESAEGSTPRRRQFSDEVHPSVDSRRISSRKAVSYGSQQVKDTDSKCYLLEPIL
ncbi:hypothetical protein CEXT_418191 [Caerostris extrusa]|uniref:Uncharacterized protein n=1 Tax=Caerostris extrusa TaxID=172846 RepID=A0AAV4X0W7_CAEEX|nr:hypothetical protein CEXT_418191 [Caerostris extrusa]